MHSKTTTSKTVEALRTVFARNGLPEQLVSDNGPQFTAEEFQLFLKKNGVKHVTSAPYHPATNGLAERFIQTMKQSLTSMKEDLGSTQTKLSKFLMKYRNTPHSTDIRKHVIEKQVSQAKPKGAIAGNVRQLFIGQAVSVRNYRGKEKWIQGIVRVRINRTSVIRGRDCTKCYLEETHRSITCLGEHNKRHSRSRTSYRYSRFGK